MSVEVYNCPADECDYGPMPAESLIGHYSGKSDDDHPGGYADARQLVDQLDPVGSVDDPPSPTESELGSSSRPAETGSDQAGQPSFPDAPDAERGCPECGCQDWFSAGALLEEFKHEYDDDHIELLEQHDRVCVECREVYDG